VETAIGCDVSKSMIDVAITGQDRRLQIANEAHALQAFASTLPARSRIGMESTGTFHEELADALVAAGHQVFVINPRWIRAYARGLGMRGKSDRSDALVIARYVAAEHEHLHPYEPPTPAQRELRGLLKRRIALAKLAAATRQSLGEDAAAVLQEFKRLLKQLERRISDVINANPDWKSLATRLRQLPGVGVLTAAQLVATLTRTPFNSVDAFIAHTGTDPRANDSGHKRGRRRLTHHGSAALRSLLFMAAMAASRNPQWRSYFDAERAKGLPATAAYVIVARRIGRIAFSLFKTGQDYDSKRLPTAAAA
jgi:transposase